MNLFWCSLDSAYNIGLSEQCILYQSINLGPYAGRVGRIFGVYYKRTEEVWYSLSLSPTARKDSSKGVIPKNINSMQAVVS